MICHYCNYQTYKINKCPNCNNDKLSDLGMGTEKLQEYITKIFPKAKVIRMDIDTVSKKNSHEEILNKSLGVKISNEDDLDRFISYTEYKAKDNQLSFI